MRLDTVQYPWKRDAPKPCPRSFTTARTIGRGLPSSALCACWALCAWAGYDIGSRLIRDATTQSREQPVPFSHAHHVGGIRHRLPLLPHFGGDVELRQYSSHQDLHELPFADLEHQPHARARARQLIAPANRFIGRGCTICPISFISITAFTSTKGSAARAATGVWTRCRSRGRRTRSRWSGASIATAIRKRSCGRAIRSPPWVTFPPATRKRLAAGLMEEYHIPDVRMLTSCSTCHR